MLQDKDLKIPSFQSITPQGGTKQLVLRVWRTRGPEPHTDFN
jgi:hypothetical protein